MQCPGTSWSAAEPGAARACADRLRAQRLALAAESEPRRLLASLLGGCALAALLAHGRGDARLWIPWLLALGAVAGLGAAGLRRYRRAEPSPAANPDWELRFTRQAALQALLWAAAAVGLAPPSEPGRSAALLLQAGLAAGCAASLAALPGAARAWLLLLLPLAGRCFAFGGSDGPLLGAGLLLGLGAGLAALRGAQQRALHTARLQAENEALVASLGASAREFDGALQQLARLRDAALAASQAKSAFLANMSHEIRTPMTSILGYAELMQESPTPADLRSYTAAIQRNSAHLLGVVNDILDLSKIEAGKMTVERIRFSAADVVGEAIAMLEDRARRAGLSLKSAFFAPFPPQISCDPVRLRQILVNLLSNAIKFTPQGGEVRVESAAQRHGELGELRVRVIDTGIGMSAEQLAQLFQPFAQAEASTARRFGGSGLGLSISRQLAQLLGGELTARSELGQGSRFELTLPLGPWASLELADPSACVRSPWTERRRTGKRFHGRVLLAEDGADNQRLITILLERCGVGVDVVGSGLEALEGARRARAAGAPHDLILMDLNMPGLDGASAARELKATGVDVPIVVLTAQVLGETPEQLKAAGFDGYVSKPLDRLVLERTLGLFLEPASDAPC